MANAAVSENPPLEEAAINALANFATSTASDRAALSKLTDTIQEVTAELSAARKKINELSAKLAAAKSGKIKGKENANPNTATHYSAPTSRMVTNIMSQSTTRWEGPNTTWANS